MPATATLKTWAIQGEDAPAHSARILASMLVHEGVVGVDDDSFKVAQDTGSNMQIKVGSGTAGDLAAVAGDLTAQGLYVTEHQDATVTLAIAASDPTNDRIDRVILRIYDDDEDSSGNDYADIEVIQGTPAGSPSAPALPSHAITLATILVQNAVTAITNSDITDAREEVKHRGEHVQTLYHTASTTFDKADYPWLKKVRVKVQAGGGGGAGAASTGSGQSAAGGGGGAGGYAETEIAVSALSASETVTVGGGGAGGVGGTNGSDGATSSFGAHAVTAGGTGGGFFGATTASSAALAGNGGAASAGDLQIEGGGAGFGLVTGLHSVANGAYGGPGGNAVLGKGADARRSGESTKDGGNYGGGGAGAGNIQSSSAANGGAGAGGIVIIELYA